MILPASAQPGAKAPLSWREFLDTCARLSHDGLTEDVLFGLVKRLHIDSSLLAPYIQFDAARYARNVLVRDAHFEAICLCWEPGQGTAVHNHGQSYGVVYVFEGALTATGHRRLDDGSAPGQATLQACSEAIVGPGALLLDRVGSIHALSNPADSGRRCVSLHFYAGPLDVMEVFDPVAGTVERKPLVGEPMVYIEPDAHAMAAMI